MTARWLLLAVCWALVGWDSIPTELLAQDSKSGSEKYSLSHWHKQQLSNVFFSEGAGSGDFNKDGKTDIVAGPFWYEGPDFKKSHAYYPPKPFDPKGYSDNFFIYSQDFSGDGWDDILVLGFPGVDASWFENPAGKEGMWVRHKVLEPVDNESPTFIDITGDGKREIVCSSNGFFGFAEPGADPKQPWKFRPVSTNAAGGKFTHGLGVGDVNNDGKPDLLEKNGWWEQPKSLDGDPVWKKHEFQFAGPGGAQMFAYDFDGDGDNDVLTSLAAHGHGLVWYEAVKGNDGAIDFTKHDIMGATPDKSPYGLVFSQLHAIDLADIDGDGVKDIVTGKRYWAHGPNGDPDPGAPPVVYWFKTVRSPFNRDPLGSASAAGEASSNEKASTERTTQGADPVAVKSAPQRVAVKRVEFIPYLIDDNSGVGVEVKIVDVSNDGVPDVIVGNKRGAFVHIQHREQVTRAEWEAAQPMSREQAAQATGNGLPPNEGLTPEEAAKAMTVPQGFKVQLAAGEPLVHQPIAFAFDARGRIWIAEAHTYPERAPEGQGKDKIVILEDKDTDGSFETRKVFIEGLNLVSGLEVGFGGVWVGAAPYLLFIPDRNGDDVPDRAEVGENGRGGAREKKTASDASSPLLPSSPTPQLAFPKDVPTSATVLLDGFGWQDTHETLNGFIWGPDGWLYGCHGVFTHSKVGKPGTPDEQRVPMNAAVWRYHPVRHQFEIFAHGASNQWGVDFNEHGQAFITACVIPHLYHVIQGGRYQRQAGQHFNPYTFDDIKTIADHAHYAGSIADHAWWGRNNAVAHDSTHEAGGGHAHAGAMIYLGDNFPARYRNTLFMANIHGNRINNDILKPRGSGYVGTHGNDFVFANDRWFRAINLKTGPDGAVYIIDWYDKNACHRRQPEIWDRTNGRVYRVSYGDRKPVKVDLTKASDEELVALHTHKNEWQVRMARKVLQERTLNRNANGVRASAAIAPNQPKSIARTNDLSPRPGTPGRGAGGEGQSTASQFANAVFVSGKALAAGEFDNRVEPAASALRLTREKSASSSNVARAPHPQPLSPEYRGEGGRTSQVEVVLPDATLAQAEPNVALGNVDSVAVKQLEELAQSKDVAQQLRAIYTLHAIGALKREHIEHLMKATGPNSEHIRATAIKLAAEDGQFVDGTMWDIGGLATSDPSPVVRLAIASALQRIRLISQPATGELVPIKIEDPDDRRAHALRLQLLDIAHHLLAHADDSDDHNLPLMIWYGVEPIVSVAPAYGLILASNSKLPKVTQLIYRRLASDDAGRAALLNAVGKTTVEATQRQMLDEVVASISKQGHLKMPESWPSIYEQLARHTAADIRQKAQFITVKFGDKSIFPALRNIVADSKADADARLQALEALVTGKDAELPKLLQGKLEDSAIRRASLRALAQFADDNTAPAILKSYKTFTDDEKQDAITTLAARPSTALALLTAIEKRDVARTDLSAFTVGQMLRLKHDDLSKRLTEVWGAIRSTTEDKQKLIAEFKGKLKPGILAAGDLSDGRAVFAKTCAKCHKLFGEGGQIGPDITGSNRGNLDYILENILDPSAVIGRDYQMTSLELKDGRVVSGLVKEDNASALVMQTINEVVTVPKADIETRTLQAVSMMPDNQLQAMKFEEQRDLLAYLASPSQVPLPGAGPIMNPQTKRIAGALEGEQLKLLSRTGGASSIQGMSGFAKGKHQWSGDQLWWTGGKPGDKLVLELPVSTDGDYEIFIGLTKARDYGIVQLSLNDKPLGPPIDGFNIPDVIHSGPLTLGTHPVKSGNHKLVIEIKGSNPKAAPGNMFGLDYIYLAKKPVGGQ